ncbi:MAG: hypothetical protein R3C05_26765 [Pirellulaceae bacterium]
MTNCVGWRLRNLLGSLPATKSLQATALVHEAYLRLVEMPKRRLGIRVGISLRRRLSNARILVESARRKSGLSVAAIGREELIDVEIETPREDLLALDRPSTNWRRSIARRSKIG